MNHYRMLILYDKDEILDSAKIFEKMRTHGISNINLKEGPSIGDKLTLQVYYDSDIPISQPMAADIIPDRKSPIDVVQEVKDNEGQWVGVDITLPRLCEAEECTNDKEAIVTQDDGTTRRMILLCNYHAQLLSNGNSFRLKQRT